LIKLIATLILSAFTVSTVQAAVLPFSGPLRIVEDDGGAIYSGVALGTVFSGQIDDSTFNGFITDGSTSTSFGCCIAAGPLIGITNNQMLSGDDAAFLNEIAGEDLFVAGTSVDIVDIEGDEATPGDGRIEVGLSYVLDANAFPNDDPGNYPFSASDVLLGLYFIVEEFDDDEIYLAYGLNEVIVPLPGAVWLFVSALGLLGFSRRRQAGPHRS
jgi:hypothetical protein